ncbi:polysaccharide pyruvyl transferase family protein [Candidatus Saccharibacteria bacterium]|nr:polysaccharide pyruvyl transferase family protein [Candidatus Saccharibacteria bacterium]
MVKNNIKRKVGILTFHRSLNYGAVLQAFALKNTLAQLEFDAQVIDYRCKAIEDEYKLLHVDTSSLFTVSKTLFSNILYLRKNIFRKKVFKEFIENNLALTESFDQAEISAGACNDFDILVAGSDQIWNENLTKGIDKIYMLNFGNEQMRRVAYAASTGRDTVDSKKGFREGLKRLDAISVREKNLAEIFGALTNKPISVVCDPVFLPEKNFWDKAVETKKSLMEEYIFCYDLEPKKELYDFANYVAEKEGLKIVYFSRHNRGYKKNISESHYTDGPLDFLSLLTNAKYVITDSFHGTAFSVIFRKKFWSFYKNGSNARIKTMLKEVALEDRFIEKGKVEIHKQIYSDSINYEENDKMVKKYRDKSKEWLVEALRGNKAQNVW